MKKISKKSRQYNYILQQSGIAWKAGLEQTFLWIRVKSAQMAALGLSEALVGNKAVSQLILNVS
jgi:hypothetical protein